MVLSLFTKEDDYFGLMLMAGWPPNPDVIDPPYSTLLESICPCFLDDSDATVAGTVAADDDPPSVYLYPSKYLYVTVATLHPLQKQNEGVNYDQLQSAYSVLV
jgi:hypothetical protein